MGVVVEAGCATVQYICISFAYVYCEGMYLHTVHTFMCVLYEVLRAKATTHFTAQSGLIQRTNSNHC